MTAGRRQGATGPLAGRYAVVTGGGRGIGAACAQALAQAGAAVLVAARSEQQVEAVAATVQERGGTAVSCAVDVTDPESVAALARYAYANLGEVDILVNNAGIASSAPIHRLELEDWNRMIDVNATGTFLCTRAFLPGMVRAGWGRVVNVASVAGLQGAPYIAAYTASKHAVIGFTRAAAIEVASKGVTVNAVCPGYVDTDMTRQSVATIVEKTGKTEAEALAALVGTTPLGRLIRPDEVAHAVVSLCHDRAGATNGQALVLDGGGFRT